MADVDETYHKLVALGDDWADANAAADLLEETRKSYRAQLVMKHLIEAKSVNKAEVMAEASQDYEDFISRMVTARKSSNKAKVKYEAIKTWIDLVRTRESTRRAEATHIR